MESTILQKIEDLEKKIINLEKEFERWFLAYQKIIDLIIPEEEAKEDEVEAIRRKEKLLKLEEI